MLYASTRSKTDAYTAYHALHKDRAPDGGMYVPYRLPFYDKVQIDALCGKTFAQTVAHVLNLFFSAHLNACDVEFSIGRYPVRLNIMSHKVVAAELWHNPCESFDYVQQALYSKICMDNRRNAKPSFWAKTAVYIAVLFGIYTELRRTGLSIEDIALPADDDTVLLAVWYARKMGLPVNAIICGCNEENQLWDFFKKGTLDMNFKQPVWLEHLIYYCLGIENVFKYLLAAEKKVLYHLNPEELSRLRYGIEAVVSGKLRVRSAISGIYRSTGSLYCPAAALSFGTLQDYRSRAAETRGTLLLAEHSPVHFLEEISAAIGKPVTALKKQLTFTKE